MTSPGTYPLLSADTVKSDKIIDRHGDDLGKIEDLMIDTSDGHIEYAVLSFGGFLGMGDKLFAIPWSALQLDTENECFTLDVDKDRLKDAPGFDKDNWPNMADPQFQSDLHTYYGTSPHRQHL